MGASCCAERDPQSVPKDKRQIQGVFVKKGEEGDGTILRQVQTATKSQQSTGYENERNFDDGIEIYEEKEAVKSFNDNRTKTISAKRSLYSKNIKASINQELVDDITNFKSNINKKTECEQRQIKSMKNEEMNLFEENLLNKYRVLTPKSEFFLKHKMYKTNSDEPREVNFSNVSSYIRSQTAQLGKVYNN